MTTRGEFFEDECRSLRGKLGKLGDLARTSNDIGIQYAYFVVNGYWNEHFVRTCSEEKIRQALEKGFDEEAIKVLYTEMQESGW